MGKSFFFFTKKIGHIESTTLKCKNRALKTFVS